MLLLRGDEFSPNNHDDYMKDLFAMPKFGKINLNPKKNKKGSPLPSVIFEFCRKILASNQQLTSSFFSVCKEIRSNKTSCIIRTISCLVLVWLRACEISGLFASQTSRGRKWYYRFLGAGLAAKAETLQHNLVFFSFYLFFI